jgi:hypothetical protein
MPRKQTIQRAKADLRAGKRPTTAAGEFVREERRQRFARSRGQQPRAARYPVKRRALHVDDARRLAEKSNMQSDARSATLRDE